jgi:DNA-binding SARP family transcriptional activator
MLRMRLLGTFEVEWDGSPVEPPSSHRAWALLAWLALHPGTHPRAVVASAFWPDVLDTSARASLRSALWALRRALGPTAGAVLRVGRDRVGLEADGAAVWVDVVEFDRLATAGRLQEAAAMACGELLAGLDEDWADDAREIHRATLVRVLEKLAKAAQEAGDAAAVLHWTRRLAALDPLAEEPQRRLMELLAATGDHAAALA